MIDNRKKLSRITRCPELPGFTLHGMYWPVMWNIESDGSLKSNGHAKAYNGSESPIV